MSIKHGILHNHSEYSLNDSAMTIKELVKTAKNLGAPAVALTDHGTMTGIFSFLKETKKSGINGIPGVETYVINEATGRASHLILMAKTYDGLRSIMKAVTESYRGITDVRKPRMTKETIERYFKGNADVIATSACVGGVLGTILTQNQTLDSQIEKIEKRMRGYTDPKRSTLSGNQTKLSQCEKELVKLVADRDEADRLAKRKFKAKEKTLENLEGEEQTAFAKRIEEEKKETALAKEVLPEIKRRLASKRREITTLKRKIKEEQESVDQYLLLDQQKKELESKKKSKDELYQAVKEEILFYCSIFSDFYVEVQYHGIEDEAGVFPILAAAARELKVPLVAANDAHLSICEEDNITARQIMRSLRFNRWEETHPSDWELYIKTDEELSDALSKILPKDVVLEAMENVGVIASMCKVEIPEEKHYPAYPDAKNRLKALSLAGKEQLFPKGWDEAYEERLSYELSIIDQMGYNDYLCIVEDFLTVGRKLGYLSEKDLDELDQNMDQMSLKSFHEYLNQHATEVGYTIGPGRGSGVGSLVNYLTGITNLDPLKYGLIFERFLNPERVSPPDIDSDIANGVRDVLIHYMRHTYGDDAVCGIYTKGTQAAKSSIDNVARVLASRDGEKSYLTIANVIKREIPNELDVTLNESGNSCGKHLLETFKEDLLSTEIIQKAMLVEGVIVSHGLHAAGLIISDSGNVSDYVPLEYNQAKKAWASQTDKYESEELGLLKMDFLGLKTLDVITDCARRVRARHGISINFDQIQFEDEVFKQVYSKGKTAFVFQFEGAGMQGMLKNFQPSSFEDLILLVACYRPGPMQYLEDIIEVKQGRKDMEFLTPQLKPILSKTYGAIVYQEQVMEIFMQLSGYSYGQADLVRRAMSKKKEEILLNERTSFLHGDKKRNIEGCIKRGISEQIANQLFDEMIDFAKYAFNKSHAAAYAKTSYMTAWAKFHYPTEFMTASLNIADKPEKIAAAISECKALGIKVLPPGVNRSDDKFKDVCENTILYGLKPVRSVKSSAYEIIEKRKEQVFQSFRDFFLRTKLKKDVMESLISAGAFDGFIDNRMSLKKGLEQMKDSYEKLLKKQEDLERKTKEQKRLKEKMQRFTREELEGEEGAECLKKAKRLQTSINKAKAAIKLYEESFSGVTFQKNFPEAHQQRLKNERHALGAYLSGHLVDEYPDHKKIGTIPIREVASSEKQYLKIMGAMQDLQIKSRRSDGAPMAFFTLSDRSGEIPCCCFTKTYDSYGEYVHEDDVVIIEGKRQVDTMEGDEEVKVIVSKVRPLKPERPPVLLSIPDVIVWQEQIYPLFSQFRTSHGTPVILHDRFTGQFREVDFKVSQEVFQTSLPDACFIRKTEKKEMP